VPDPPSPHTTALEQLLELRRRYLRAAAPPLQAQVPDAELMVLSFLAAELGLGEVAVDDAELLAALRAAGVEDYVGQRSGRPFALRPLEGPRPPGPDVRRGAWLDGRHASGSDQAGAPLAVVFLYGIADGAPVAALQRAAAAVGSPARVVGTGRIAAALWRCTATAVVHDDRRQWLKEAVESLRAVLGDPSLDALPLAAECLALRARVQKADQDEAPLLRARVAELEDEVFELKTRLVAQQSAIARQGGTAAAAADDRRPDGRWNRT
jgi:hypothetical protein